MKFTVYGQPIPQGMSRPLQRGAHFSQEFQEVDRTPYPMQIRLFRRGYSDTRMKYVYDGEIMAMVTPTVCPYLVMHQSVDKRSDGLVLTHTLTHACVARNFETEEAGRFIAGALMYLFRWSEEHRPKIVRELKDLHPAVASWVQDGIK